MSKFELSLFDNSADFFEESVRQAILAEKKIGSWKYAILFIVQSIELALKEQLSRAHPLLIWEDVDKPGRTVGLERALRRISNAELAVVTEVETRAINQALRWRNEITHYKISESVRNLKMNFATLAGFYLDFVRDKLGIDISGRLPAEMLSELSLIEDYRSELINRARKRMDEEQICPALVWQCPECQANTFVIDNDINCCYTCGLKEAVRQCGFCDEYFFGWELNHYAVDLHTSDTIWICDNCKKHQDHNENFDGDWDD